MKKIIFSVFLLAAAYTLAAQEVTVYRLSNTSNNTAVSVPTHIRYSFERAYPGITVIDWEPVTSWWRATYNDNNRVTHVYYNSMGDNYRVALPVLQNNVPEDVVSRAITLYGPVVYGITKIKSSADAEVYQVRLLENGVSRTVWMDAAGTAVTDVYKVKVDEEGMKIKSEQ